MEKFRRFRKLFLSVLLVTILGFTTVSSAVLAANSGEYFYNQLSSAEQGDYTKLYDALKDGNDAAEIPFASGTQNSALKTADAVRLDHVELFWLGNGYGLYGNRYTYEGENTFHIDWKKGGARYSLLKKDITAVTQTVENIVAEAKAKGSDWYTQLKYAHDWLTHHNEYNDKAANGGIDYILKVSGIPWSAFSALTDGEKPVCEGYSRAFKMICDRLDIPCIIVGSPSHMWNQVQMGNGKWYAVDCTFDDPSSNKSGVVSGNEGEGYFLIGSDTSVTSNGKSYKFSAEPSHNREDKAGLYGTLDYPNIEKTAYTGGDTPTPDPGKTVLIKSIKASAKPSTLKVGQTAVLTPKITPNNATNKKLTWKVTSKNAVFEESGSATYTGEGDCTLRCTSGGDIKIQITANDKSKKKATLTVKGPKAATGVTVSAKPKNVTKIDGTVKLTATVKPKGQAAYDSIEWKITSKNAQFVENDAKKITGTETCNVRCLGGGKITIKVTVKSAGKKKTANVTLKGLDNPKSITLKVPKKVASGQKFNAKKLQVGDKFQLKAVVNPNNAFNKEVEWTSNKPGVASVDQEGNVECIIPGDVTIKVKSIVNSKANKTIKLKILADK